MSPAAFLLALPLAISGRPLPSQHYYHYHHGCTPGNRHCERCRCDGCPHGWQAPVYDYRRNFNYPWRAPYHRPAEDVPCDMGPRIIRIEHLPSAEGIVLPLPEELPPPTPGAREDESSPSDRPPRKP